MTKAEQEWSLIEALVYCKGKRLTKKSCAGCPYAGTGCAIDATIAKLKAQEPRVMTLDELSEKTDVYFESLVYDTICPALSSGSYDDGTVGLMTLENELFYMDEADYGVQWRCWTRCPTDEQRRETPWK